jgi:hypothetical protein
MRFVRVYQLSQKNIRRMVSSGLLRRVALVRTDVSEELGAAKKYQYWYFFAAYVGCYLQLVLFLVHRFMSP